MKIALPVFAAALLFACAPTTASVDSPMEAELENDIATTSDALVTSNKAELWFPMAEGNSWELERAATGDKRTVKFEGVYEGIGLLSGLTLDDGRWMGGNKTSPNSLYTWTEATNTWEAFVRFGYATTSWSWGEGACNAYKVKRSATNLTVTTPAGTFTGARTIAFERKPSPTARCQPPAFTELTFAPGVGLIAVDTYDGKFLLKSAKVNGATVPSATTGVKGVLKLDKATYVNKPNTIYCITTPCPGNDVTAVAKATYTLSNSGTKSETFQFTSGCQFDLKLIDAAGTVVRSLAENRFCTLSLTSLTLAPGESKTYSVDVALSTRGGEQLFGNYTAKATLIPTNAAPVVEATATFTVKKP